MDGRPLGYLEPVEFTSVWKSEAGDFLPWLAAPVNLRRLGNAVGLDLEPVARETRVGHFRADLLCRDRDSGSVAVIEAQLGPSDHRHLGQILTYACALRARTVIWLAARFHAEHRAVLDRLNETGAAGLGCFAVEMALWKIGASPTAPLFSVVAEPRELPFPVPRERDALAAGADAALPRSSGESPLRAWRKRTGLSMERLAAAAGISRSHLSHIETGRSAGTQETRAAIARVLGAADEPGPPEPPRAAPGPSTDTGPATGGEGRTDRPPSSLPGPTPASFRPESDPRSSPP